MADQGSLGARLTRMLGLAVARGAKAAVRQLSRSSSTRSTPTRSRSTSTSTRSSRSTSTRSTSARPSAAYEGDFTGKVKLAYAPVDDGRPDPGEVVWAWVPYEEDHSQGKDRPVLVIARDGDHLLGLMLTSKDHDRDHDQEAHFGRYWLDIGTGAWDREGRPSEVRLDRILRLDPSAVRREGAVLDRASYDRVAVGVRRAHALVSSRSSGPSGRPGAGPAEPDGHRLSLPRS